MARVNPVLAAMVLVGFAAMEGAAALPRRIAAAVEKIRAVGPEGKGHAAAQSAWADVAKAKASQIPDLLVAMDGANDYALNWLRSAVETAVQRETAAGATLPVKALEGILRDARHHPRARRLAFELIRRIDTPKAEALLPGFLQDPGSELRRDAVAQLMARAATQTNAAKAMAVTTYREALGHAREADQIEDIAKRLQDLGDKVDLAKTFGWVSKWQLVGPFDNTGEAGFAKVYPPEERIEMAAELPGKSGPVKWFPYETRSEYGLVDFNQAISSLKGAVGYAVAEFWSDSARTAQVRLGCKNGWKVWVNGALVFGRDEYHRSAEIDQYRMPVTLKAGRNLILVKCAQNEQTQDWAKEWEFQLRVTDEQGTPIVSTR
jgi:hypothetical protein